jgi:hypothetical protein
MLTPAGRITKGLTDRRSALAVPLNSPRSRQTELTNHRSGGLGAEEPRAVLRRARELSYLDLLQENGEHCMKQEDLHAQTQAFYAGIPG